MASFFGAVAGTVLAVSYMVASLYWRKRPPSWSKLAVCAVAGYVAVATIIVLAPAIFQPSPDPVAVCAEVRQALLVGLVACLGMSVQGLLTIWDEVKAKPETGLNAAAQPADKDDHGVTNRTVS
jgi:drug/metabolite transporter (DMT)-like permease